MRILAAEDDAVFRKLLQTLLPKWGYEATICEEGTSAWSALSQPGGPSLAVLDWQMPGLDGTEICARARERITDRPLYLLILTSRSEKSDVVQGLGAGADDYLTKPFSPDELKARLKTGERVLRLEAALHARVHELEEALANVKTLQGLLPICSYCKKVRDDGDYWHQVESYVGKRTGAQFSHSVCPDCYVRHVQPQIDAIERK
jgi:DNA-binding response OmpR family regulator